MRVISGTAKGRQLKGPPGHGTRPMTDRLKTSLFNILAPYGFEGARVLDLYAGTGSLGIEMLSRGAEYAHFVEQSPQVCRIISDNLNTTKLADRARVFNMPVALFIAMHRGKRVDSAGEYDIIVLDPPYADPAIPDTLETIALSPLLSESGIVVIGHANRVKLADDYGGGRIKRVRHRNMGDSAFSIYEAAQEADGRQQPDQLVE
jgi:16S rRNA (guanine(966)-N(2))-methyltransferase RsmD